MGGEGSMMAMIHAIKNNKSLLAKRKDNKKLSGSYGDVKLNFPEATPELLQEIRERMRREKRQQLIKTAIAVFVVLAILIVFLTYII